MPSYSELASKLLVDAGSFFVSLANQNAPIKEQMLDNANVYKELGKQLAQHPSGLLDGVPLSELATKLLNDAAQFFDALGEQNDNLKQQMTENATVFRQMAKLLEEDPTGQIGSDNSNQGGAPDMSQAPDLTAGFLAAKKPRDLT